MNYQCHVGKKSHLQPLIFRFLSLPLQLIRRGKKLKNSLFHLLARVIKGGRWEDAIVKSVCVNREESEITVDMYF